MGTIVLFVATWMSLASGGSAASDRLLLSTGWTLRSSVELDLRGEVISRPGLNTASWHRISVPNTVVGALVENGVYEDPYFGMNLRDIPGTTYPIGQNFAMRPMPEDSPFRRSWWYRREFTLPARLDGRSVRLHFDGINFRANVWVNGTRIADSSQVAGAYRRYAFNVTSLLRAGEANAIAVEVFAPEPRDLAFTWVDWNPMPADKDMGLWGEVYLTDSGPLELSHPHVVSELELPSLDEATLSVSVEVRNTTDAPVEGVVRGAIEERRFEAAVTLAAGEHRTLRFTAEEHPALRIANPRVWWPYRMGTQELYTLALDADVGGSQSDRQVVRFGIQEMSSELTEDGHRLFRVNGRPILVRGGGWAPDMMLRPAPRERLEAQLRYTREMGLNTIRLEGKLETDLFYDLADEYGILVMPGWCCCSHWERWAEWDDEDYRVGPASLRDQALRLRNHPSVLMWLNGSDHPPPADVEQAYLDVLAELEWSKPIVSNATDTPGPVSGPSGVKMRGPYAYVPPSYWLTDTERGGAFGFATEIGPGAAVPPLESLERMLPADRLWPINEYWMFHAGGGQFRDLSRFTEALEARYGPATNVEDYARKAQALAYEGQRAMFEAYGRNKYRSTGVIQWMLNDAWPSLIWHLYDHYLRPGGGYYGTKKACEPVHVQFSYDDRSVAVVNDEQHPHEGLTVTARLLNLDLSEAFAGEVQIDLPADTVVRALTLPRPEGLSRTHFLVLEVTDAAEELVSSNFYWLSTQEDVLDWENTRWYYTPTETHADLTALADLPETTLALDLEPAGPDGAVRVRVRNTGSSLAFQVHVRVEDADAGQEVLPVFWSDNYLPLLPGESRTLTAEFLHGPAPARVTLTAEAWNAQRVVR
ncbi:MAG: glycosyl hydrolase family 2 [Gemmatimonadales bacterium]|nr:glycosyl hydrolase family 2 [Gemmatimonadales bacterium]NIN10207.1 glycosyl hydrolase family 2 [Gemmatimonadales bacterium]NIN48963.1 glycosyl hydrolase family 2 [Gemmatimonadales bacterium]NIP06427.1 glycosyl hydrolase family 2 [Gemmatimonadales bacterium]NIQ98779.1 glycosyl hydrolase family 2 [Gemmatimonadales bacterium]